MTIGFKKSMARPALIWLIADTHFFHQTMSKECGWPEGYGEIIVGKCRKLIASQDTLIHLGDVIFYQMTKLKSLMERIPGKKILVKGNHDKKSNGWYERNGFVFVADQIVLGDTLFSHAPMEHFPSGTLLNIHGHCHEKDCEENWYEERLYYKLDPVAMGFGPIRLIDIQIRKAI